MSPSAVILSLLLGSGCASSPLLSTPVIPAPDARKPMLTTLSEDFPPGTQVVVHAVGPELLTEASGTVAEWNAADGTLILEDCRVRERPSTWINRSPYLDWAERDASAPEVPIAHLAIPVGEIKSLEPVSGASLQRRLINRLQTPPPAKGPPLTLEQEQQIRDRDRRIRAAAGAGGFRI